MSWKISRFSSSLLGLLRDVEVETQAPSQTELIRARMMECMADYLDRQCTQRPVWRKVMYAPDIQSLWYLRSEVMHLLCDYCGETLATHKLQTITELFRGHVPAAQFASSQRRT